MNVLSRFRKGKKSDGADNQAVADADEGLLMPTEDLLMPKAPAQPSADSGGNAQADADAMLAEAGSGSGDEASATPAENDDLVAAAPGGADGEGDVDDLTAAAQAPPATDEIKAEEPEEAAADDDLLSAFKIEEVQSDLTDLTKDIEEIAMTDLLEQLRDVRGMLPATSAEDEDAA